MILPAGGMVRSWPIAKSTLARMRSPGRTLSRPAPRARIFSVIVMATVKLPGPAGRAGDCGRRLKGAGRDAEAKAGVAQGGAHRKMRYDEGPGPLTHASASRAGKIRLVLSGHATQSLRLFATASPASPAGKVSPRSRAQSP